MGASEPAAILDHREVQGIQTAIKEAGDQLCGDYMAAVQLPATRVQELYDAIAIGAKVLWMQLGIRNDDAAQRFLGLLALGDVKEDAKHDSIGDVCIVTLPSSGNPPDIVPQ